ncbi:DUF4124 domain-containing protein [Desulfobacterales bacterium HSG2]|nr:DUF4124 domain-containing protein [Desulfobacterales bacterium HSG2]
MRLVRAFFSTLLFCLIISGPAAGMYIWTDENGVKHFSDAPPSEEASEEVKHQADYDAVAGEKKLYEKANQLMSSYRGDFSLLTKAGLFLERILESNPNSALAYVGLSRLARKEGRIIGKKYKPGSLEESREFLLKAIRIDPALYDAYRQGVYLHVASNNLPEARKAAKKARELSPDAPETDILFAVIALEEGDDEEVIRRSNSVISKTADKYMLHDAYFFLTKVYKKQKKYDLVEDMYLKTMKIWPDDAWNLDSYAGFLYRRGRYDEAITYGEKALSIMDFYVARKRLGKSYYKKASDILWTKGQPAESIRFFLSSIKYHPTANAFYGLGTSYARIGKDAQNVSLMEKAASALEKAIELESDHKLAQSQLAKIRKLLSDL